MEGKYLVTTDEWFIAPDGKSYKSVWGDMSILEDSFLGIATNRNSTNWYAKIGNEENHVIIAGCQIHYAVKSEKRPYTEHTLDYAVDSNNTNYFNRPTLIYIPE